MSESIRALWLGPTRTRTLLYAAAALLGMAVASMVFFVPGEYILFAVGGAIFVYLLLTRIDVAIILMLLLQYFMAQFNYLGNGTPFHPNGFMGIAIIGGAVFYFAFNKVAITDFRKVGFFLLFFLLCVVSTALLPKQYLMDSLTVTLRLATALSIFAVLLFKLDSIAKTKWLVGAILGAQIFPTISHLLVRAGRTGLSFTSETLRAGDSGVGISMATMTTICVVFLLEAKSNRGRLLWGLLTALFGAALFFSFGRAAWIAFLVAVALIGVVRHKWVLIVAPLVLVLSIVLIPGFAERFSDINASALAGSGSSTLAGRVRTWDGAMILFQQHPVFGVGIGAGAAKVAELLHDRVVMMHNDYLSVLLETGLVGMALFLAWHAEWIFSLIGVYRKSTFDYDRTFTFAVLAVWVLSLVARFTDNMVLDTYDMYPLCALAAAAMALPRLRSQAEGSGG